MFPPKSLGPSTQWELLKHLFLSVSVMCFICDQAKYAPGNLVGQEFVKYVSAASQNNGEAQRMWSSKQGQQTGCGSYFQRIVQAALSQVFKKLENPQTQEERIDILCGQQMYKQTIGDENVSTTTRLEKYPTNC